MAVSLMTLVFLLISILFFIAVFFPISVISLVTILSFILCVSCVVVRFVSALIGIVSSFTSRGCIPSLFVTFAGSYMSNSMRLISCSLCLVVLWRTSIDPYLLFSKPDSFISWLIIIVGFH
ncbi:hypothetical protein BD560DRAFT_6020 [Blakeslea trispora]|nr:hypothetical protein BD560DRAFT_6020 [Blakeslea trispora]